MGSSGESQNHNSVQRDSSADIPQQVQEGHSGANDFDLRVAILKPDGSEMSDQELRNLPPEPSAKVKARLMGKDELVSPKVKNEVFRGGFSNNAKDNKNVLVPRSMFWSSKLFPKGSQRFDITTAKFIEHIGLFERLIEKLYLCIVLQQESNGVWCLVTGTKQDQGMEAVPQHEKRYHARIISGAEHDYGNPLHEGGLPYLVVYHRRDIPKNLIVEVFAKFVPYNTYVSPTVGTMDKNSAALAMYYIRGAMDDMLYKVDLQNGLEDRHHAAAKRAIKCSSNDKPDSLRLLSVPSTKASTEVSKDQKEVEDEVVAGDANEIGLQSYVDIDRPPTTTRKARRSSSVLDYDDNSEESSDEYTESGKFDNDTDSRSLKQYDEFSAKDSSSSPVFGSSDGTEGSDDSTSISSVDETTNGVAVTKIPEIFGKAVLSLDALQKGKTGITDATGASHLLPLSNAAQEPTTDDSMPKANTLVPKDTPLATSYDEIGQSGLGESKQQEELNEDQNTSAAVKRSEQEMVGNDADARLRKRSRVA